MVTEVGKRVAAGALERLAVPTHEGATGDEIEQRHRHDQRDRGEDDGLVAQRGDLGVQRARVLVDLHHVASAVEFHRHDELKVRRALLALGLDPGEAVPLAQRRVELGVRVEPSP